MSSYFFGGFSAKRIEPSGRKLEPLRMLLEPRMVERALHREVERDLHVVLAAGIDQPAEVLERAQLRIHRVMAAVLVADRVEAAGIVGPGVERIVLALAVGAADRMDRREVETSKPSAAISGTRAMQSSNVPCLPGTVPWLRGTISYQAPRARALAVGLQGNNRAAREIGSRLGLLHRGRQRLVEQDARIALGGEFLGVGVDDQPRLALARLELGRGAHGPRALGSVTSCPASLSRLNSLRQVANWSVQASMAKR